jgi:hypothetical protein
VSAWTCPCGGELLPATAHQSTGYTGAEAGVLELGTCRECRTTRARSIPVPAWGVCHCEACRDARRERTEASLLRAGAETVGEEVARRRALMQLRDAARGEL